MTKTNDEIAALLKPHRTAIDALDKKIIDLLRQRYDIIDQVSTIKQQYNIPAILPDRVTEVRENAAHYAATKNLDEAFIRSLWQNLIDHACETEQHFLDANKS